MRNNNHSIISRRTQVIIPKNELRPPYVWTGNVRDYNIKTVNNEVRYYHKSEENQSLCSNSIIYCGRTPRFGGPSILGNPFRAGRDGTLDEVVDIKFRKHLYNLILTEQVTVDDLKRLAGCTLLCHCKPAKCHTDVIANAVRWAIEQ